MSIGRLEQGQRITAVGQFRYGDSHIDLEASPTPNGKRVNMTTQSPVYTRMFMVSEVYGISEDTVRRWAQKGLLTIHKRGRMSFVRTDEIEPIIESMCGAECGASK